jgi:hypothetical protein
VNDVEHEREIVEVWPDGSKIIVDKWRSDAVAPWIYGTHEVFCGRCGIPVADERDRTVAFVRYFAHAIAEMQAALMLMDYGRGTQTR